MAWWHYGPAAMTSGIASGAYPTYWCGICGQPITGPDIDERHTTDDGEDCHAACCPKCNPPKNRYTYSTGRCANGAQRDQGRLLHAIPLPADGSPASDWQPALCGYKPGRRSNGWSAWEGTAATCPRCKAIEERDRP